MNYKETKDFQKDFKKLFKKYKSLNKDLEVFKKVLEKFPKGNSRHFAILTEADNCVVVKARFFCKYLRKKSLRVIYSYSEESGDLEFVGIEFIEVYFKGSKEREDKKRIDDYLKNMLKYNI